MKRLLTICVVAALVLAVSGIAQADTINVPGDYLTIQGAIDAAASGDTIIVANGTYTITAAINVNKGVTITGNIANPENVVVTYSGPSQTLDCFDMQANNVIVQGIKVVNGRYGFNFAMVAPTGCTISNCVIDHCYEGAINIDGGSGHTISDNTITNCLTSGTKRGAIHIYGCPDVTIDGNTLIDNGLTGYHATMGIYVKFTYPSSSSERVKIINNDISGMLGINADIQIYNAPYTYIYNNTISNSEDKGIAIFGIYGNPAYTSTNNRVEVIGNTISSTCYPGLQACNAPYTYFCNNTLTHCNYYGGDGTGDFDYASIHIDSGSAHCLINSNTVSDGINGIQVWSSYCTITNNTVTDMGFTYEDEKVVGTQTYKNSGILVGSNWGSTSDIDPTGTVIQYNNIYDNYWGLFYSADLINGVTATLNWWGDVSGPYHPGSWYLGLLEITNPDGLGDKVSDYVLYSPWIGQVGRFVTGGGTIWSDAGNYRWDVESEGQANFGFVSKYKKGKNVPDGSTNFVFQAGDLHFHSSSYDLLVVTGSEYAMFKGTGTINGSGEYKFMLWAGDGGKVGNDTFRIKIWTEDENGNETVVYDNGTDQVIDSGSIVVHTK